ncbi:hypothetical protein I4U23_023502 [Adineta vaga]|nr:hypothetical protein I4U23_023502 [Adineta vaga]
MPTRFEDLPNELIYEIFELFDIYRLNQHFSNINQRFQDLLTNSSFPIHINISSISKTDFNHHDTYYIQPNIHRIKSIYSSNPFTIKLIDLVNFPQLENLTLNNTDTNALRTLLYRFISSSIRLSTLSISIAEYVQYTDDLYLLIFQLPQLKYLKVSFQNDWNGEYLPISTNLSSPIEHLIIEKSCHFNELLVLLSYTPQLRYLTCIDLHMCFDFKEKLVPLILNQLTHVSLKLFNVKFDILETFLRTQCRQLEVLRLSTSDDHTYSNAS